MGEVSQNNILEIEDHTAWQYLTESLQPPMGKAVPHSAAAIYTDDLSPSQQEVSEKKKL